ncbi:MAG: ATPase [Muribaculaceae bacterium]|nr:ATPase [Muribaculaceae bacterium]
MDGLLIADAGSSKTEWSVITDRSKKPLHFRTEGINPAHESFDSISIKIEDLKNKIPDIKINDIFFYGAGCATDSLKKKIYDSLLHAFQPRQVTIESDLVGAGLALFGTGEGIACILGTGSNTGIISNGKIIQNIPSLGFILGDEGGAVALGKSLINAIFKRRWSKELINRFEEEYGLTLSQIIERVYRSEKPAPFIASFTPFLSKNIDHPEVRLLLENEFDKFFQRNILPYGHVIDYKIGMIGSIAYVFKDIIQLRAENFGIKISGILSNPLPNLEKYHIS